MSPAQTESSSRHTGPGSGDANPGHREYSRDTATIMTKCGEEPETGGEGGS
jgi:hypothetical protein